MTLVTHEKFRRSISLVSFISFQEDEQPRKSFHRSQSFATYIDIHEGRSENKLNVNEAIPDRSVVIDEQIKADILESQNHLLSVSLGIKRKRSYKDLKFVNAQNKSKTFDCKTTNISEPHRPIRRSFTKQISEFFEEKSEHTTRKLTRSASLFNLRNSKSEAYLPKEFISVKDLNSRHHKNESNSFHFRLESYNVRNIKLLNVTV